MAKADLRPQIEAMAEGRRLDDVSGNDSIVEPDLVAKHQRDFVAWAKFSTPTRGEPLAAPSEILAPLP